MSSLSRSVYLSRLRRAFLLRVHPDRFRNHSPDVRNQQANLIKALADRLSQSDFVAWQHQHQHQHSPDGISSNNNARRRNISNDKKYPYVVERRDGSLLKSSIQLSDSVDDILKSMAETLKKSGVAKASLPKLPRSASPPDSKQPNNINGNRILKGQEFGHHPHHKHFGGGDQPNNRVRQLDHRFDVQSRRGRDLWSFLSNLSQEEVSKRRMSRTDAQAAALEVRRLYRFQSVNATTLGWSSASVAVLLGKLLDLHEEHSSKFSVDSFYPATLLFTSADDVDDYREADDGSFPGILDVYGGILRINPAMTPLQWSEQMEKVKPEHLHQIVHNRAKLVEMVKAVQGFVGVKLKRGNSCTSPEYFRFVRLLYESLSSSPSPGATTATDGTSSALILEPITVTVESSSACRRPIVTKEGTIRLGTTMRVPEVHRAVSRLAGQARQKAAEYQKEQELCKRAIEQMQWELGLQRVYRTGTVSSADFLECLSRILHHSAYGNAVRAHANQQQDAYDQQQHHLLKVGLAGNSLGVASSGHFCHLADDGSVVIPYDWR